LQLQQLLYADLSDAYRDIVEACRRLDTALSSAVYLPALRVGAVQPVTDPARACIEAAADASVKLLAFSVRARQQAFDRIAGSQLAPGDKQHLVNRASERISRVRAQVLSQITRRCPVGDFVAVYGQETGQYLLGIDSQSGCHAQYVYVQDAVVCPAVVCGNGIQEPTEECDDTNELEGDGCLGDCTRGEATERLP
jgi:cysteine-rich repeat protein